MITCTSALPSELDPLEEARDFRWDIDVRQSIQVNLYHKVKAHPCSFFSPIQK